MTSLNDTGNYTYTSDDLWRENEAYARSVIPSMVFVALLMALGVPGNGLAVYVFGMRLRMATQHFLIVCLAVCDLLLNLVAMPSEIADLRFHLTFSSEFACRLLRFVNIFGSLTSNCILVVIAVDRYRRVCHPLRRQMTIKEAKIGAALSLLLALATSWPIFVMTGLATSETSVAGLYGKECSFSDDYKRSAYPAVLLAFLGAGFLVMTLVLIVLYTLIWRQAHRHRTLKSKRLQHVSRDKRGSGTLTPPESPSKLPEYGGVKTLATTATASSHPPSPLTPVSLSSPVHENRLSAAVDSLDENNINYSRLSIITLRLDSQPPCKDVHNILGNQDNVTLSSLSIPQDDRPSKRSPSSRIWTKLCRCWRTGRKWRLDKASLVAFAVTVVFVLSFLPYLTLMLVRRLSPGFVQSLHGTVERNAYNIFLRFYFLNAAANPVIYGVLNARFRQECVTLFHKLTSFLCCCSAHFRSADKPAS